jgi:N-acetyl-anhydromuramyl-L-alanine amidase AmpD
MLGHVYSKHSIALSFVILIAFIAQFTVGIRMTHAATAHAATASHFKSLKTTNLPQGCTDDGKTDYPGAIDCILNPNVFSCTVDAQFPGKCAYNCKLVPTIDNNCTYTPANRPKDTPVQFVTIHDAEGTLQEDLKTFQNITSQVGIHYIVDTDGTVYQLIHDQDITYHTANFLYNDQAIGIEHVGFDATGYTWYNAAQYLGSAKLVAYLLDKYNIPLDHDHIVSHGTIPAAYLKTTPNHVDPGPYWLWDYYFNLIKKAGDDNDWHAQFSHEKSSSNTITLHPFSGSRPLGGDGHESKERNFNFFSLYQGPSTNSGLIPQPNTADVTDETANVEPDMTYYYVDKAKDPASDDTMYEIWYGEADQLQSAPLPNNELADAKLAWLAVPPEDGVEGGGTGDLVSLPIGAKIYSHPNALTDDAYLIGYVCNASGSSEPNCKAPNCDASNNKAIFVSTLHFTPDQLQPNPTEVQDGAVQKNIATTTDWYEINFNHRQAWVPSAEVTVVN